MSIEASLLTGTAGAACKQHNKTSQHKTVLSFNAVSKRFGTVVANDAISFSIESGGIHALVGENGAGKSTLSKILYGYYRPDRGSILLNGTELSLNSPSEARQLGIGMVHQQLALVPSLTGFENVLLGHPNLPFAFNKSQLEKKVILRAREFGFEFDLKCPVANLGIADRQKLEMFKLLWRDAQILILDEPTSQLTPFEADDVLGLAENLAGDGRIVILITHHINEVMRFARHVTVLRKGKCIATVDTTNSNSDDLATLMVDASTPLTVREKAAGCGASLLSLRNVSTRSSENNKALSNVNLDIRAGEIIGVAGISGSGQTELGRLIAGLLKPAQGTVLTADNCAAGRQSKRAPGDWVCYIPSEQKQACALGLTVAANSFIKTVKAPHCHIFGFLKTSLMHEQARQIIHSLQITPALPEVPAGALSGGNLQRLIIGRELATPARIVVADNPCAGLDAAMAMRIGQELRRSADAGRGVVLISPDIEELISTCDRILVMFNGRINGEQNSDLFDYQSLALLMGGKPSHMHTHARKSLTAVGKL
jgi:simple sugar transport system ATP-binding protein